MVEKLKIDNLRFESGLSDNKYSSPLFQEQQDISIFNELTQIYADQLSDKLEQVEAENGAIKQGWNAVKETVGLGVSAEKCETAIEQYKNGKISFEEASETIDKYSMKQDNSLNLFSNIVTAVAAIGTVAIVVASGGVLAPVAAVGWGALAGAVTKAGFKLVDKTTNDVKNDVTAKEVVRDALSGAVTGGIAVATMGTASGKTVGEAVVGCAKTGLKTGAVSGSSNYVIDCAFDENKDFNTKEFIGTTLTSTAVGGTVGAIMGGVNSGLHANEILQSGCNLEVMRSGSATIKDVAANSACTAEYKILNRTIRDIAA